MEEICYGFITNFNSYDLIMLVCFLLRYYDRLVNKLMSLRGKIENFDEAI
ncbi:hypothetical protein H6P87_00752 [Rickettsia tillamookensis]|uniref:Uncharacterized protein n=1 Tax=Rickettsia tillamookensis TaxID=2761623 RepID=A0A9E6SQJ3_9RICK|nr:hypothetical protein H6P87_00752 [Rickettsia tillamookensis]